MTGAEFRYLFTDDTHTRISTGWEPLSQKQFLETAELVKSLPAPAGPGPVWAQDLLQIARAMYLVDKRAARNAALDGWTRTIHLVVQLVAPDLWRGQPQHLLEELLRTLTGDIWHLTFQSGAAEHPGTQGRLINDWRAEETALFSAGLDSTAYAAERAGVSGGPMLLIAYCDSKLQKRQAATYRAIERTAERPIHLQQTRQTVRRNAGDLEQSTRSRGLLFLATAIYAAAAHNCDTVAIPENGQLAINPPLSPGRLGACSTRSVHPRTIDLTNQTLSAIGAPVTVTNPFLHLTKGEVCRRGLDAGLTPAALFDTVSCGHPPLNYRGGSFFHCGYCYPCLVRQSGLWHAMHRDDTPYQRQFWNLPPRGDTHADLRALQHWLDTEFTTRDLIADMRLPGPVTPNSLMPVLLRGRDELRAMLDELPRSHRTSGVGA